MSALAFPQAWLAEEGQGRPDPQQREPAHRKGEGLASSPSPALRHGHKAAGADGMLSPTPYPRRHHWPRGIQGRPPETRVWGIPPASVCVALLHQQRVFPAKGLIWSLLSHARTHA